LENLKFYYHHGQIWYQYSYTRRKVVEYWGWSFRPKTFKTITYTRSARFVYSSAFVQEDHQPQELDEREQNRRAWRKHKKFVKDKGRNASWHNTKKSYTKFMKKYQNKQLRQAFRQKIHHEDWDSINGLEKSIRDPWAYDW